MSRIKLWILLALSSMLFAGCATVGKDFPVDQVSSLEVGKTTMEEVKSRFGSPWRTGYESGRKTWTYGKYRYKVFGESQTTDLVIRFDSSGKVHSYSFNTTEHNE